MTLENAIELQAQGVSEKVTCAKCRYKSRNTSDPTSALRGEFVCKRFPPQLLLLGGAPGGGVATAGMYPPVSNKMESCAEYVSIAEPAAILAVS